MQVGNLSWASGGHPQAGNRAEGCRWLSKGAGKGGGEREVKVAKQKGKKPKASTKLATTATTKLYKKLEEESVSDMIEVDETMDPPQGWTLVDLEEHVGPGEQGLIMMQKKTAAETVSVLSSFQFVGTEDDFEEEEEEDEDESAAPSFICLLVIDKHGSSKPPIFAQCVVEEDGPRIAQLSIGMGMPGNAYNTFGPFNFVYQTYALISSMQTSSPGMLSPSGDQTEQDDMSKIMGMSEEELEEQVREFEQSLSKEDKDHLAKMQAFAREHMAKLMRGEELSPEDLKNSPMNPENTYAQKFIDADGNAPSMMQQTPPTVQDMPAPPPIFMPEFEKLSEPLQVALEKFVRSKLEPDVVDYMLQSLAMKEQTCYAQFLNDTKKWVNPLP